jgi:polyketide synthase 12
MLSEAGVSATVYQDLDSLHAALGQGHRRPDLVLLDGIGEVAAPEQAPFHDDGRLVDLTAVTRRVTASVLSVLQGWLADDLLASSRLAVLTRGAIAAGSGDGVQALPSAGIWGLVRSAQSESPGRFTLIDLDTRQNAGRDRSLWCRLEYAIELGEPQIAERQKDLLVARLARGGSRELQAPSSTASPWRLDCVPRGTLDGLVLVDAPECEQPLEAGTVRVQIRAAGLNFRDALIALDVYPGAAALGGEGAGVVLEVAPDVEGITVGDRVMGILPHAFGTLAVTDRRLLARVPEHWSFARAAATPVAFLTAYYGLVDLAGLCAGERVLIHAGAGGVGMAAIQLARHFGAEVFATASPAKWDTLRELGLDDEHIASSRTTDFAAKFLEVTDNKGVHVVLNSLARELVDASLQLLPLGGRFIEMGKTDIRDPDVAIPAFSIGHSI